MPVSREKMGHVITNGVHLESHEYDTVLFLTLYGFDIELIKPNNTPKIKNPDFCINGVVWEAKSPEGSGRSTIERHVHKAGHQAHNLVLDLRRIGIPADRAEREAIKQFSHSKGLKRLLLITQNGKKLLDIKK